MAPNDSYRPACLLVFSTQRTGSSLLCDYLQRAGLGKAGEFFLLMMRSKPRNEITPADFFAAAEMGRGENGTSAINVMSNQLAPIAEAFFGKPAYEALEPEAAHAQFIGAYAKIFGSSAYLRISRSDRVAQAVSRLVHRKSGVAHVKAGEAQRTPNHKSGSGDPVDEITGADLAHEIFRIDQDEAHLDAVLAQLDQPVCDLTYEDLTEAPERQFQAIWQFFGWGNFDMPLRTDHTKVTKTADLTVLRTKLAAYLGADPESSDADLLALCRARNAQEGHGPRSAKRTGGLSRLLRRGARSRA
ncbi:Stf0 family sulfotransferase [Thioclava sp.]|uniref:Stf0 family sulfotransferase n=1 Tax=Thioclava sp. TaxID=1933450 RepID=UPI003241D468